MSWISLQSIEQLNDLKDTDDVFVVFKHSTRCPVSSMAKRSMEHDFDTLPEGSSIYILDLIALRNISNFIAEEWGIKHESPQLLVLKGGSSLYHASHQDVELTDILPFLS